jgi:hypothetical protein
MEKNVTFFSDYGYMKEMDYKVNFFVKLRLSDMSRIDYWELSNDSAKLVVAIVRVMASAICLSKCWTVTNI